MKAWDRKGKAFEKSKEIMTHLLMLPEPHLAPPNVVDHFPTLETPNLMRVGDVRQNVLNRRYNYGHKPPL